MVGHKKQQQKCKTKEIFLLLSFAILAICFLTRSLQSTWFRTPTEGTENNTQTTHGYCYLKTVKSINRLTFPDNLGTLLSAHYFTLQTFFLLSSPVMLAPAQPPSCPNLTASSPAWKTEIQKYDTSNTLKHIYVVPRSTIRG